MTIYEFTKTKDVLRIETTATGRLIQALTRVAIVLPMVFGGLGALLLPDFIGRYQASEPVRGLFWLTIFAVAVFIAGLLGLIRLWRRETWTFDGEARILAYHTSTPFGGGQMESVKLSEVICIQTILKPVGQASQLMLTLRNGHQETLCQSRWKPDDIVKIRDAIRTFMKDYRYSVEWVEE